MLVTIGLFLLLVVTGGFISYYGDLQGRRWGKKRVSWFGMRPKHTAILITSLTGAGIAFFSAIALMIVAPSVRHVVLRGEAAINENRRIREEQKRQKDASDLQLKQLAAQTAETEGVLQAKNKLLAKANSDADALKGANSDLEKRNGSLVRGNLDLQQQRATLVKNIERYQKQLPILKRENARFEITNKDLASQNTQYSRQNADLARDNARLLSSNASLNETNSKLKTDNVKLGSDNANLKKTYNSANEVYIKALDTYQALQENYRALDLKNTELKESYGTMKGQLDALTQERNDVLNMLAGSSRDFVRDYIALRQTRYNLRANTEIARRTLDAHLSAKAAEQEITALLKDASDRARRYGAVAGDNGRAVVIVSKRVVTPASVQMADETASIHALVDAIAGSNTPVVVVARAINNTSANEQVLVELTPYSSTTVFAQGAPVASRAIDTRQPMEKLVQSVIVFLKEDVRNAAIKSGTIPQISPESGEEEIGMIDTPEMVTLIDRIRRTGGTVQITAVANEAITSGDLLTFGQSRGGTRPHNLRFDLKRVSGKSPSVDEAASG